MKITLRPYQEDSVEKTDYYLNKKGIKSGILHLATGGGKTVITTHIIDRFWNPKQGKRSIIVGGVNRVLTFQMWDALKAHFPYMGGNYIRGAGTVPMSGIVMGNYNHSDARVVVGSVQTLISGVDLDRLKRPSNSIGAPIEDIDIETDSMGNVTKSRNSKRPFLVSPRVDEMLARGGTFDLWVHDEAHHSPADGSVFLIMKLQEIRKLLDLPPMKIVGNTATPARADDRGLHTLFETVLVSYGIDWMQRHDYLAPFADPPAKRVLIDQVEVDDYGNGTITEEKQTIKYTDNWADLVVQSYFDEMQGRRCFGYWGKFNGPSAVEDSIFLTQQMIARGIRAAHIDATHCVGPNGESLPKKYERKLLKMLNEGQLDVINSGGNGLVEGIDVPAVDGILLGRPISSDNPVLLTQIIGRGLRKAPGKENLKLLEYTGQQLVLNGIADLTGYTVDPTSGQFRESIDPYAVMQMFMQLWRTRPQDVEKWIAIQKRFKESTIRSAIEHVLRDEELSDTELRALKDCNDYLLDEDKLLEGMNLKDVREEGKIRGVNQTYELVQIVRKSSGAWYADNRSALMTLSISGNDSFVINPPNHTYASIAQAVCEILVEDNGHELLAGKTQEQKEKMLEFFTVAQRLYQNFTVWHLCGAFYNLQNAAKLWILEDLALDVLESDALAYARDNIEDYVASFADKKKQKWGNQEATPKQLGAAASVLHCHVQDLPEDVQAMNKGEIARFINHTACVNWLTNPKSPLVKFDQAIEKIKEIV